MRCERCTCVQGIDVRARHSGFCMSVGVRCEGCTCVHSGLPRIKGNEMVDSNGGMEYWNDF